jgi:hypothetical protein
MERELASLPVCGESTQQGKERGGVLQDAERCVPVSRGKAPHFCLTQGDELIPRSKVGERHFSLKI